MLGVAQHRQQPGRIGLDSKSVRPAIGRQPTPSSRRDFHVALGVCMGRERAGGGVERVSSTVLSTRSLPDL
jgi:hypothetical protein